MDAHDYFKKSKVSQREKTGDTKAIGLIDSLPYKTLIYGFQENILDHGFELYHADLKTNAQMLRQGEIEMGLISPLDYALKKESWLIVPDISLTSHDKIKHVQLFFKKGLKDIRSIAVDEKAVSERVLLEILMKEKFVQSPEYIPMTADIDKMFAKAEAALVVDEKALEYYNTYQSRLDLNDEWMDLTGLPFVYAFWAGREMTVTAADLKMLLASFKFGINNLEKISKDYAKKHRIRFADIYYQGMERNGCYACGFGCHLAEENNFIKLKKRNPELWKGVTNHWGFGKICKKCGIDNGEE